ncbi:MAG: radical SAM protein [Myxococcaceae bacterium]
MNLKDLDIEGLTRALAPVGAERTAVLKLFACVFAHGARSLEEVRGTRMVSRVVRDYVQQQGELPSLSVVERRRAADGFVKYLFGSPAGGRVEAVRIPIFDEKHVVCISSQVGCALACEFCQTGKLGFARNLSAWEMVDQVLQIRAEAKLPVRGVVFMGMGEPLLNYEASLKAARILCHPAGLAISAKAITFSTAGWVPAIRRYVREEQPFRLAFSIVSAMPEKRARLMPVERTHPLPELVDAVREYAAKRRERAMLAYVMISGVNTGREDALALAAAFEGVPLKVDLIDVADPTGRFLPPDAAELAAFRDHLQVLKAPIARRYSGGKEIGAACGTLAGTSYGGELIESG